MNLRAVQGGLLLLLAAACPLAVAGDAVGAVDRGGKLPLSEQRLILSEGYSQLHIDAGHLDLLELVLYVKSESAAVGTVVTAISEYGDTLERELERIARDYPGVRIDLDPLPEMEKRKRFAVGKSRALYFAPIVGHGGVEYERTLLVSLGNALNHEAHLCQVMAAEEPDAGLKKFLLGAQQRFEALRNQTTAVLERDYFKGGASGAAQR